MTASSPIIDRKKGAFVGALVGEALALGCHWYYDLDALRRDFGPWISDYTTPKPGRYHAGMRAGELSQDGLLTLMLARSIVDNGAYVEGDFTRRLDEELFPKLDGQPSSGPGGYTSQSIRDAWRCRVREGKAWGTFASPADTTEAMQRAVAIAIAFAEDLGAVARDVARNVVLTQNDGTVVALSTAFNCVLAMLVTGEALDAEISSKLMKLVRDEKLPFYSTKATEAVPARPGQAAPAPAAGAFASPDALLSPSFIARAAADPDVRIEPAWKVSLVYGMPCAVYHQLPAAYYLAARYATDFESGVLHAVNGGGQNMARAFLVGALIGAQVGLAGIPRRFVDGLADSAGIVGLATRLADVGGSARVAR